MIRCILLFVLWLSPGFAQTSLNSLRQAAREGLYPSVITLAPDLISREPNNAEAHFLFALALYYTGDLTRARLELNQSRLLNLTETADVAYLDGLLKAAEGNIQEALKDLRKAFEQAGNYQIAMDWGNIAWEAGNYQEALDAFERASQTPIGQTLIWPELNRARILHLVLGDYENAILAYERAIETFISNDPGGQPSPGYVEAYFRLGQIAEAQGNIDEAISNYRSASFSDPNYEPAIVALERLGQ